MKSMVQQLDDNKLESYYIYMKGTGEKELIEQVEKEIKQRAENDDFSQSL